MVLWIAYSLVPYKENGRLIPNLILKVASLFFMILRCLIRRFLVRRNYPQGEI